jgi:hypothetical protein
MVADASRHQTIHQSPVTIHTRQPGRFQQDRPAITRDAPRIHDISFCTLRTGGLVTVMPEPDNPERVWDEYDWERFLQQQDRKTERYMELLEKYMDHPNREEIIAREMGWNHMTDEDAQDWSDAVEALFEYEDEDEDDVPDPDEEAADTFEKHPLYQASFQLTVWIDQWLEEMSDLQHHPAAVKLATNCAIASAKLAAALSDDDIDEIGMTIAYLKRALKAVTTALDGAMLLDVDKRLSPARAAALKYRLFQLRDGIVTLMGDYRAEFRRRHGN